MAIIVQKYGGTSVGSIERIEAVAETITRTRRKGHQVVAVLSAMAGETERLIDLAKSIDPHPASRELDVLLATGEQTSVALLSMALIKRGFSAISLLAHQIELETNNQFGRAHITQVNTKRLLQALEQEQVAVVAGFQGVDADNNITTLGRGGSDTTAVAIAAKLQAAECQIFTDVDGIYTADPRIVPKARQLSFITFDDMLLMARLGAKVLHTRSVETAQKFQLPIRVRSSFSESIGTLVTSEKEVLFNQDKLPALLGICYSKSLVLVTIEGLNNIESMQVLLSDLEQIVDVDVIESQTNQRKITCLVNHDDFVKIKKFLIECNKIEQKYCYRGLINVAKISLAGQYAGEQQCNEMFKLVLSRINGNKYLIYRSDRNISVILNDVNLTECVGELHNAFDNYLPT